MSANIKYEPGGLEKVGALIAMLIERHRQNKFHNLLQSAAQPKTVKFPGAKLPFQPPAPVLGQFPAPSVYNPFQAGSMGGPLLSEPFGFNPLVGGRAPAGTLPLPMPDATPAPNLPARSIPVMPSFEEFLQKVFQGDPARALKTFGVERFMPKAPVITQRNPALDTYEDGKLVKAGRESVKAPDVDKVTGLSREGQPGSWTRLRSFDQTTGQSKDEWLQEAENTPTNKPGRVSLKPAMKDGVPTYAKYDDLGNFLGWGEPVGYKPGKGVDDLTAKADYDTRMLEWKAAHESLSALQDDLAFATSGGYDRSGNFIKANPKYAEQVQKQIQTAETRLNEAKKKLQEAAGRIRPQNQAGEIDSDLQLLMELDSVGE